MPVFLGPFAGFCLLVSHFLYLQAVEQWGLWASGFAFTRVGSIYGVVVFVVGACPDNHCSHGGGVLEALFSDEFFFGGSPAFSPFVFVCGGFGGLVFSFLEDSVEGAIAQAGEVIFKLLEAFCGSWLGDGLFSGRFEGFVFWVFGGFPSSLAEVFVRGASGDAGVICHKEGCGALVVWSCVAGGLLFVFCGSGWGLCGGGTKEGGKESQACFEHACFGVCFFEVCFGSFWGAHPRLWGF